jgi:hypothetical protein
MIIKSQPRTNVKLTNHLIRRAIPVAAMCLAALTMTAAMAQPLADPVVSADAELRSQRASSWQQGATRYVLLENDVTVAVGSYGFRADSALVRIDDEQQAGRPVRRLAMVLLNARGLPGKGPTSAEAGELLVTASTTGQVDLLTDLLDQTDRSSDPFVAGAQARIEDYRQRVTTQTLDLPSGPPLMVRNAEGQAMTPDAGDGLEAPPPALRPGETMTPRRPMPAPMTSLPAPILRPSADVLPTTGVVSYRADKIILRAGESDSGDKQLVLIGHVRVVYQPTDSRQGMSLSAENAVIFLSEDIGSFAGTQVDASDVLGVYLEDNVIATNGDYTVRSPRVYYDLQQNKAVLLDAVMYTWDVKRQIPLYVRAAKLRQESGTSWAADEAVLTTSEFAKPHFSIGAREVTIRQDIARTESGQPTSEYHYTARDNKARVGSVPVFYWPKAAGRIDDIPLRRAEFGFSQEDGPEIKTRWDVFTLIDIEKPDGVDLTADIDWRGRHGAGLGLNAEYDRDNYFGLFDSYILVHDDGTDEIANRDPVGHQDDVRGFLQWQHRHELSNGWEMSLETAYVSDETFLEQFFRNEADTAKQYETSLYLKKAQDDSALTFLSRYDLNDFVTQMPTLQSSGHPTMTSAAPGYTVDKAAEATYRRIGTSLWGDKLTYFGHVSGAYMRRHPTDDRAVDRGFTLAQSMRHFGISNTMPFDTALGDLGLNDDWVGRLDSRHELQMPTKLGILDIVPYVAGRATVYSEDTRAFDDSGSTDSDTVRWWGGGGLRLHTQFSRTFDRVENRLLDLHRLRHIIEPTVDINWFDATGDADDYALYDYDVDTLNEGFAITLGLRNTLQTERGGPGRWRTVDWLVLNTAVTFREDEQEPAVAGVRAITPRYFAYRPENSFGGDFVHADMAWMITDTLAMIADWNYDIDAETSADFRIGLALDHTPALTIYVDYVEIAAYASRDIHWGFDYRLTTKYALGFNHRVDLSDADDQTISLSLTRQLPRWKLVFLAEFDELETDQTIGVVLIPEGFGGSSRTRPTFYNPHVN